MKIVHAGITASVATFVLGLAGVFAEDAFDWTVAGILATFAAWGMWGMLGDE